MKEQRFKTSQGTFKERNMAKEFFLPDSKAFIKNTTVVTKTM